MQFMFMTHLFFSPFTYGGMWAFYGIYLNFFNAPTTKCCNLFQFFFYIWNIYAFHNIILETRKRKKSTQIIGMNLIALFVSGMHGVLRVMDICLWNGCNSKRMCTEASEEWLQIFLVKSCCDEVYFILVLRHARNIFYFYVIRFRVLHFIFNFFYLIYTN